MRARTYVAWALDEIAALRAAEKLGSGSAARSGALSSPPRSEAGEREDPPAPPAALDLPDPNYADDLAYADYWENRL